MAEPVKQYVITPHAAFEMERRKVTEATVRDVLQSRAQFAGKTYLVRVFVYVDRNPAEVVTVYRTGRIAKYWRDAL